MIVDFFALASLWTFLNNHNKFQANSICVILPTIYERTLNVRLANGPNTRQIRVLISSIDGGRRFVTPSYNTYEIQKRKCRLRKIIFGINSTAEFKNPDATTRCRIADLLNQKTEEKNGHAYAPDSPKEKKKSVVLDKKKHTHPETRLRGNDPK